MQAALELFREHGEAESRLEALIEEAEGEGAELTSELRSEIERRAAAELRVKSDA